LFQTYFTATAGAKGENKKKTAVEGGQTKGQGGRKNSTGKTTGGGKGRSVVLKTQVKAGKQKMPKKGQVFGFQEKVNQGGSVSKRGKPELGRSWKAKCRGADSKGDRPPGNFNLNAGTT